MIYSLLRYGVLCLIIVVLILFFRKLIIKNNLKQKPKKVSKLRAICIIVVLGLVISMNPISKLPFENLFLTFSSPESAYRYANMDSIKLVVEGEQTALVLGNPTLYFVVKSNNGWKLPNKYKTKYVTDVYYGYDNLSMTILIEHYVGTDDYYVCVDTVKSKQMLSDNRNSQFYSVKLPETFGDVESCYAYVKNLDNTYRLNIDDKEYDISNLIQKLQ